MYMKLTVTLWLITEWETEEENKFKLKSFQAFPIHDIILLLILIY